MLKKTYFIFALACIIFSCSEDADDFIPVCDKPLNISSSSIAPNFATITWEAANVSTNYIIEYGVSGFTLGNGSTVSASDTNIELTGLEASTTYDVYIQTICASNNTSLNSDVYSFTTSLPNVATEFSPVLSQMNLFVGNLEDLQITPYAFEYNLNTTLFSDYAHKQRIIALPEGTSMEFDGDGLPIFPNNTVIAKTFFYNNDERDLSLGRKIIETRVLIRLNGVWEAGDYKWNDDQTEAVLDGEGSTLPVTWIDATGNSNSTTYKIPSNTDCFTCHGNNNQMLPIGPKLRSMNFNINGVNQLQQFIDNQKLTGLTNSASVRVLPNWEDTSLPLATRARAYMDINCAHCHIPGGTCADESSLNLAFETPLANSNIADQSALIAYRVSFYSDGVSMPFIGTTMRHTEGLDMIIAYLNTL
ncbi:fibronectin type III domain-containing protein [Winogradskyella bathintestinalis]|uniref:Fibronectin type III domain-containing protein n=1 Tax=Winogradskyella bathintestinalis TaxID=3035208 RepID=A0ABT7ZY34_9FLAO|nr:fibronectin type III domain-containing protein [Winogradskyella bathintestinalis]MDN3493811.1 fibronectin type III domain-containing protein [Winogradskyella bathintestinalis]